MRSLNLAAFLAVALTACSFAQESRGTIAGRATDPSGSNLTDVQVHLVNEQMGTTVEARTNESGLYTIPYLIPGFYTIRAERSGFKKLERTGIEVRVGETST